MARPSTPESKYFEAFTEMLTHGKHPEKITATDLQNAVGGRFDKARKLLEKFQAGLHKDQQESTNQPDWFKEAITKNTNSLAMKLWYEIDQKIRKETTTTREEANNKVQLLSVKNNELAHQISLLENKLETSSDEVERLKNQLAEEQGRRKQAERLYQEANNRSLYSEKEIGELKGKLEVYSELENQEKNF